MLAAHYLGNREIRSAEVAAAREPGPGEVRIRVAYAGICGTDLHIRHGNMDARVPRPAVLGHESSGTVDAVGADVTGWAVGDAVSVMPLAWCGECPACLAGHTHVCHRLNVIGVDSPGALQNRWIVPASTLVRLPADLDLRSAALLEPLAVAVHDVTRARLAAGEHALVVGGGPIGALVAFVAASRGAHVLVSEPDADRRALIERFGVRTIDPIGADLAADVADWTDGAGAAVAFEVSGTQPGVDAAIMALATRGRLVVVAIHATAPAVNLHRVFWRELELFGARVYERADFEAAADLLGRRAAELAPLISDAFPLSEVDRAFDRLEAGGVMKVLIDCTTEA